MHIRSSTALILLTAAVGLAQTPPIATGPLNRIEEAPFGTLGGAPAKLFTLANAKGMKVRIITYGAIIAGIQAPDKEAKFTNVVCTADTPETFQRFGTPAYTVGRVANRVAGASFILDGQTYNLQRNDGANTLHSGNSNFGTRAWDGKALPTKDHEASAQLTFISKDGDGGYPGNLTVNLTFTLNDDNEFHLDYQATCDKATPFSMTNHAYFNLAGAQGWGNAASAPTADQEFWIDADKYVVPAPNKLPTGQLSSVKDTPFDFTKPMALGARSSQLREYDHAFVLNSWTDGKGPGKPVTVARLRDPKSGREMEVRTDQPSVQLYTGQRAGIALETQHFPDSLHHDNFPSIILKPGETFKSTTIYAFSAK